MPAYPSEFFDAYEEVGTRIGRDPRVRTISDNVWGFQEIFAEARSHRQGGVRGDIVLAFELASAKVATSLGADLNYGFGYLSFAAGLDRGRQLRALPSALERYIAREIPEAVRASLHWSALSFEMEGVLHALEQDEDFSEIPLDWVRAAAGDFGRVSAPLARTLADSEVDEFDRGSRGAEALSKYARLIERWSGRSPVYEMDLDTLANKIVTPAALRGSLFDRAREEFRYEARTFFTVITAGQRQIGQDEAIAARGRFAGLAEATLSSLSDRIGALVTRLDELEQIEFVPLPGRSSRERADDLPAPQPYGVSPRGAEFWVRDALRALGAEDASVTKSGGDGGVDVITGRFVVSVKHYSGAVPVEEVREIFGVAAALGKIAMLWTSGVLTSAGIAFARQAPVLVVNYDVKTAAITGATQQTVALLESGSIADVIR